jgi:hypothetical protein
MEQDILMLSKPPSLKANASNSTTVSFTDYETVLQVISGELTKLKDRINTSSTSGQEIQTLKTTLKDSVERLNLKYENVFAPRQLNPDSCYEVFEYYHQHLTRLYIRLVSSLPQTVPN